jgi:hypothetical protein
MKKNHFLLCLMLLVAVAANAQTNWVVKKLDDKVAVKFPSEPEKVTKNGNDSYIAKEKDSVWYSAVMMDLKVSANLDSATLAPLKDNPEFVEQLMKGIASQKKNYTFGEVKIDKWKTFTTYYTSATENVTKSSLSIQMIVIGSKMYSFSVRVPADLTTKNAALFFGSIELLK